MGTTSVDPHALHFAARRLDEAADLLEAAVRTHLGGLQFPTADGSTRSAISELAQRVAQWQQGVRDFACAVRAGADRYVDEDRHGAGVLR